MLKNISVVAFLVFVNSLVFAQIEAKIGISEIEFIQGFPNLDVIAYENTNSYKRAVEIYGIEDFWVYHFEDSVLNHIYFMKYNDEIDQKNFSKYLSATNSIIIGYTAVYGSPDDLIIGDTVFVDPYVERHWGYDVIEAKWHDVEGMNISVKFDFFGGKGEYNFIFTVDFFDIDSPDFY